MNISSITVDSLYSIVIDIALELEMKDIADGLKDMINLMDEKQDPNLDKVVEITHVLCDMVNSFNCGIA